VPDWKALLDNEFDLFEPINLAQNLVRIPSISGEGGEVELARFIANYFIDRQIKVEWQEVEEGRANLIAEVEGVLGEGPNLLFNGHLDTVPIGSGWTYPPLGGEIVENRLYGRGACDMKGALASMIYATYMISLFAPSLYGKLKLVLVVDEEGSNLGVKHWIKSYKDRGEMVDFGLVGEPTGLNISLGHRGVAAYQLKVKGKSCHMGIAEQGINAIYLASRVIQSIEDQNQELKKFADPDLGNPTLHVGMIQGGTFPNVVPDNCTFEVDVRTVPNFPLEKMEETLRNVLDSTKQEEEPRLHYQVSQSIPYLPSVKISRDLEGVKILSRSISDVPGEIPTFAPFPASCEASFLVEAGIPTLIFGPGRIEEAHTANEFISVTQIVAASRIYSLLALLFLGGE